MTRPRTTLIIDRDGTWHDPPRELPPLTTPLWVYAVAAAGVLATVYLLGLSIASAVGWV